MASLICVGCSATYSIGARCCPQCGADDPVGDHEVTVEQVRALIAATPDATVKAGVPATAPSATVSPVVADGARGG